MQYLLRADPLLQNYGKDESQRFFTTFKHFYVLSLTLETDKEKIGSRLGGHLDQF